MQSKKEYICNNQPKVNCKQNQPKQKTSEYHISLTTQSGITFDAIFYDRKSNNALVFGQGFPGDKESGIDVAELFDNYDVIIFDYRWTKLKSFFKNPKVLIHPFMHLLHKEKEEVIAVINYLKTKKIIMKLLDLVNVIAPLLLLQHKLINTKKDFLFSLS